MGTTRRRRLDALLLAAGAGGAAAIRAWELRVRTPAGSGLWLRTESFRRFLAASSVGAIDPVAARCSRLAATMFSDTSRMSIKPSSGGSDGGGFGGGGGAGGGGGGSW
jgi:uncharacterized membrane protein YgcG